MYPQRVCSHQPNIRTTGELSFSIFFSWLYLFSFVFEPKNIFYFYIFTQMSKLLFIVTKYVFTQLRQSLKGGLCILWFYDSLILPTLQIESTQFRFKLFTIKDGFSIFWIFDINRLFCWRYYNVKVITLSDVVFKCLPLIYNV